MILIAVRNINMEYREYQAYLLIIINNTESFSAVKTEHYSMGDAVTAMNNIANLYKDKENVETTSTSITFSVDGYRRTHVKLICLDV